MEVVERTSKEVEAASKSLRGRADPRHCKTYNQAATVIERGTFLTQTVQTLLPYRETSVQWTGPNPTFLYGGEVWVAGVRRVSRFLTLLTRCWLTVHGFAAAG